MIPTERGVSTPQADATLTMLAVAAGELDEAGYADWIRAHSARG